MPQNYQAKEVEIVPIDIYCVIIPNRDWCDSIQHFVRLGLIMCLFVLLGLIMCLSLN
jgi:hypothetical protein